MTMPASRRFAIQGMLASALAPALTAGFAPPLRARGLAVAIPEEPMVLTRVVTRQLGVNDLLRVERRWEIRFVESAGFTRVDGSQIGVTVEAPGNLAAFARLEEQREERGVLPMVLEATGMIASAARSRISPQLDAAIASAQHEIETAGLDTSHRDDILKALGVLQRSTGGLVSAIPADLFYPRQLDWAERRQMHLPGGMQGEVLVQFSAQLDDERTLLKHSRRHIETRIGESTRMSGEAWELEPA